MTKYNSAGKPILGKAHFLLPALPGPLAFITIDSDVRISRRRSANLCTPIAKCLA